MAIQRQFVNFHDRPTQTSSFLFQTVPVFEIHFQPGERRESGDDACVVCAWCGASVVRVWRASREVLRLE